MLGQEFAVGVGDGDFVAGLVAVGDDEDLLEGVCDVDFVGDFVESDGARCAHGSDACVGG